MKRVGWTLLMLLLTAGWLAACDVNFNGYTKDDTKYGWSDFDAVYSGKSPVEENDDTLLKINFAADGTVNGELESVFWSTFTGTLKNGFLQLSMDYIDQYCENITSHAEFFGVLAGDRVSGQVNVWACEWYEFEYTGELVGGKEFHELRTE